MAFRRKRLSRYGGRSPSAPVSAAVPPPRTTCNKTSRKAPSPAPGCSRIENLTRIRYQAGAASLQDVLDKENATRGVEESLLSNRYEQLTRSLTLHLALGGNLQDNEAARPQPSPTAREGE